MAAEHLDDYLARRAAAKRKRMPSLREQSEARARRGAEAEWRREQRKNGIITIAVAVGVYAFMVMIVLEWC